MDELLLCHGHWHTDRFQSILLGCISCTSSRIRLSAQDSQFAEAIPHEATESDRSLGPEIPSKGLEELQKGHSFDRLFSTELVYTCEELLTVMLTAADH